MARLNLYAGIHKAIRSMLNDLVARAGHTEWNSRESIASLVESCDAAFAILNDHAHHENTFIGPALAERCRDVYVQISSAHHTQDNQLVELRAQLVAIDPRSDEAAAEGHGFVVSLARVVGEFYTHMSDEEEIAMPALREAYDEAALVDIHQRLLASIPPPAMIATMRWMIPAMNHFERVELLSDIQRNAPPPVLGALLEIARVRLTPSELTRLEADLVPPSQRAA
jgi:hypothetical protein